MLCGSCDAKKTRYPGPARWIWPLIDTSRLPSLIRSISSQGWWWTGWEIIPGLSVVTCTSNFSRVGVGASKTARAWPTGVNFGTSASHSAKVVPIGVLSRGGA